LDDDIKQQLLTGMFVEAQIITGQQSLWALPKEALAEEADKKFVYCLAKSTSKAYYFKKVYWAEAATNETHLALNRTKGWTPQLQFLVRGAYTLQSL
jgi:cobalt-zinc-cadmium efflux system membrane fusion protein